MLFRSANGFSWKALMPDYTVAGMPEVVGYILSAVVGVALLVITFKLISNMKRNDCGESGSAA